MVKTAVGTIAKWDIAPAWYHVVAVLLVLPLAWVGGLLAERTAGSDDVAEPLGRMQSTQVPTGEDPYRHTVAVGLALGAVA